MSPLVPMRAAVAMSASDTPKRAASSARGRMWISGRVRSAVDLISTAQGYLRISLTMRADAASNFAGSSAVIFTSTELAPQPPPKLVRIPGILATSLRKAFSYSFCDNFRSFRSVMEMKKLAPVKSGRTLCTMVLVSGMPSAACATLRAFKSASLGDRPGGKSTAT